MSSFSSYAVIAYGCASCPKLTCERDGCQTEFCYHCKQIWHPNQTCDMARQQRAQALRVRTKHTSGLSYGQESGPGMDSRVFWLLGAVVMPVKLRKSHFQTPLLSERPCCCVAQQRVSGSRG